MIELSSETQQATTDQWREKTHALTSEMTEMQRGHSEALKAASAPVRQKHAVADKALKPASAAAKLKLRYIG